MSKTKTKSAAKSKNQQSAPALSASKPSSLDIRIKSKKHPGERAHEHRALLLWAMQDEGKRSYRVAAAAVHRSDSTIRSWKKRNDWISRVEELGGTAQAIAMRVYRTKYLGRWGQREVAAVEANMSVPFLPNEVAPKPGRQGQAAKTVKRHLLERDDNQVTAHRHLGLLDAAIGTLAQKVAKGEATLSMRDLPGFLRARNELADILLPPAQTAMGGGIVETVRVRMAKQANTSTVTAMYEDTLELSAILGALVTREQVDQDGLHQGGEVVELPKKAAGGE
ncbi:MAG: hypothetical protein HRU00_17290 [Myxococcales bacterium]|nr:hypothetical protein [Myxococcales bacterium]